MSAVISVSAPLFQFQHFLKISKCEENEDDVLGGKMEQNYIFKKNNEIWHFCVLLSGLGGKFTFFPEKHKSLSRTRLDFVDFNKKKI